MCIVLLTHVESRASRPELPPGSVEDPHDTVQDNKYDNNNAGVMSLLTM
jgi:hypothetical protein